MDKSTIERPVNVTFLMEVHLGHETYYRNLRNVVDRDARLAPKWVEVDYHLDGVGSVGRLLDGPAAGVAQIVRGLGVSRSDIVFTNTQVPAVLAGRWLSRTPTVVSTDITPLQYDRMADLYDHAADGDGWTALVKHEVNRRTFGAARRVLPWSHWCAESVRAEYRVDPDRIEVVPPGVDLDRWPARSPDWSNPLPRILFVGGQFERKGGDRLLEAFRRLPVGSAELHVVTRSEVNGDEPGVVVHRDLSPNSTELMNLYRTSDVFALPSRAEAFGIAAIEALASGLPVIASQSGGLADIVDGDVGCLVDPDDDEGLYRSLSALVTDEGLRRTLGRRSRQRAEQCFDADRNAARIADLLVAEVRDGHVGDG